MTIYILLILSAIGTGMAISVYTFGTGGKRKRIFQDIYFSVEDNKGVGVVYTKNGEYAAILRMENPVDKYSADIDGYYEYTRLFTAIVQTLGEGYALHKQDIFVRKPFREENGGKREYLSESYFRYFDGREYTDSLTYLTVTQEAQKSRLFSFDNKRWRDFLVKIRKVQDQLKDTGVRAEFLTKEAACEYIDRYFAMDFTHKTLSMNNFKVDEECVRMGDQKCKIFSLVDVDSINLPGLVRPFANIEVNNTRMPRHGGKGIQKFTSYETFKDFQEFVNGYVDNFYFEEFIDFGDHDYRIEIFNGNVIGTYAREKTHTFKTNISSGGIMRPCSVSNEQISLAQKAVESLKITTSIVDIVTDRNKRNYILEVNPIMGIFVEAGMKYSDKSIIKNPDLSYSNDELKLNVLVNYIKQIIE